jgi:nitrogen regulatory protein PII-like uncharacterized protein
MPPHLHLLHRHEKRKLAVMRVTTLEEEEIEQQSEHANERMQKRALTCLMIDSADQSKELLKRKSVRH